MGVMVISTVSLGGCSFYTKEDLSEYTKQRLREEYGEEFGIKTVIDGHETVAYPVNNTDLIFEAWYVMSNGNGYNSYLQEIICNQYKNLIEEAFVDFRYEHFIDVDINIVEKIDAKPDITIEEFDEKSSVNPTFNLYLSCESLDLSDERLYEIFESVASIHDCEIYIYIISNADLKTIKNTYLTYPKLPGNIYRILKKYTLDENDNNNYDYGWLGSSVENSVWSMNYETFKTKMKEVRSNEHERGI